MLLCKFSAEKYAVCLLKATGATGCPLADQSR